MSDMNSRILEALASLGLITSVTIGISGCAEEAAQAPEPDMAAQTVVVESANRPARLLSAFFGLDNALSERADRFCPNASRRDGMPVVLSHTVDEASLQPEDFQIITRSGVVHTPYCVTLRPAADPGEHRTVLLIGEFGDAGDDPPVTVAVVDELRSDGEPSVNFRGLSTTVIPLDAGPSIVLAKVIPERDWRQETEDMGCPDGVAQVVRVTWTGGVRRPDGSELGEAERRLYQVEVIREDGSRYEVVPAAVADLEDRDNNHLLCLDVSDRAVSVSFPAGYLVDPNKDLNPDTQVAIEAG